MNGSFTVSSGPFDVPIVEHVVIVKGDSAEEVMWRWELLRGELYTAFPRLKNICAYIMEPVCDSVAGLHIENILIFFECDPEVLREICDRLGGEYVEKADHFEGAECSVICDGCKWMQDYPKEDDEFPCSKCIHNAQGAEE